MNEANKNIAANDPKYHAPNAPIPVTKKGKMLIK
jgi:hypothetical protein